MLNGSRSRWKFRARALASPPRRAGLSSLTPPERTAPRLWTRSRILGYCSVKKPPTVSELGGLRCDPRLSRQSPYWCSTVVAPFLSTATITLLSRKQFRPTVEIPRRGWNSSAGLRQVGTEKLTFRQPTHVVAVNLPNSKVESLQDEVRNYASTIPRMSHGSRGRTRTLGR